MSSGSKLAAPVGWEYALFCFLFFCLFVCLFVLFYVFVFSIHSFLEKKNLVSAQRQIMRVHGVLAFAMDSFLRLKLLWPTIDQKRYRFRAHKPKGRRSKKIDTCEKINAYTWSKTWTINSWLLCRTGVIFSRVSSKRTNTRGERKEGHVREKIMGVLIFVPFLYCVASLCKIDVY